MREHRLYQSDWLMRFYDYSPQQRSSPPPTTRPACCRSTSTRSSPGRSNFATASRSTSTARPAKCCSASPAWAVKAVDRIVATRRWRRLRLDDVARLTVSVAKVRPFIVTTDWRPGLLSDRADLTPLVAPKKQQLELFAA